MNEYSIQEVAKQAGTTSRTLRHYDDEGLLAPSRVGNNGYRYYDQAALVRLQRILLLRELGLGLPAIKEALERQQNVEPALAAHIEWLQEERRRIDRQIKSIKRTITALEIKGDIAMSDMMDGFDQAQYRDEVEQRWGKEAADKSNEWWDSKSKEDKVVFTDFVDELNANWIALTEADADPAGEEAQTQAAKHVSWLASVPGTPASTDDPALVKEYVTNLGEIYVSDDRFAENYGGIPGATFVRDALAIYCERSL